MTSQQDIKQWFDETYRTKGLSYLRPVEAYQIFVTLLDPQSGTKHLDVACGPGQLLKAFEKKSVQLYGIDLSSEAVAQAQSALPEAQVYEGNAEQLPFEDNHFDTLTCIGSLERMMDRPLALSEQYRVAKPGGRICSMVRNSENVTWKYLLKPFGLDNRQGHQDALNLAEWRVLFEGAGFVIESVYPDHWPWYRLMRALPFGTVDTSRVRDFPMDIRLAYEFIFCLRKP